MKIEVAGGKYTVQISEDGRRMTVLRHGAPWPGRSIAGDNLVHHLATELGEAREQIAKLRAALEEISEECVRVSEDDSIERAETRAWLAVAAMARKALK